MSSYKALYRLSAKPIASGAQAAVFKAEEKASGQLVALKRRSGNLKADADRMRREIDVQSQIEHLNVMPILDYDRDDHAWFTMPIAEHTLETVRELLSTADLSQMVQDCAKGLREAHSINHIHRDLKPSNILRLKDEKGERWVVADWGLVRGPAGLTTAHHTVTGNFLGTLGYAPPEAWLNAHDSARTWDVYSLGRVLVWASTGSTPAPNMNVDAREPWRRLARILTDQDASRRPKTMDDVIARVRSVILNPLPKPIVEAKTVQLAEEGDIAASTSVFQAAESRPDDAAFFIDTVAKISGRGLEQLVHTNPTLALELTLLMVKHLDEIEWGHRDFRHISTPLKWIYSVAKYAESRGEWDLMERAAEELFSADCSNDRFDQNDRTRSWIQGLTGEAAARVALLLRENPKAVKHYKNRHFDPIADSRIRHVVHGAG